MIQLLIKGVGGGCGDVCWRVVVVVGVGGGGLLGSDVGGCFDFVLAERK